MNSTSFMPEAEMTGEEGEEGRVEVIVKFRDKPTDRDFKAIHENVLERDPYARFMDLPELGWIVVTAKREGVRDLQTWGSTLGSPRFEVFWPPRGNL